MFSAIGFKNAGKIFPMWRARHGSKLKVPAWLRRQISDLSRSSGTFRKNYLFRRRSRWKGIKVGNSADIEPQERAPKKILPHFYHLNVFPISHRRFWETSTYFA